MFIVGCEDNILPLAWGDSVGNLDEERRLLFVGMTRAKQRLYLSHARKRYWRGQVRPMRASMFLKDIKEELLSRKQRKSIPPKKLANDSQLQLF